MAATDPDAAVGSQPADPPFGDGYSTGNGYGTEHSYGAENGYGAEHSYSAEHSDYNYAAQNGYDPVAAPGPDADHRPAPPGSSPSRSRVPAAVAAAVRPALSRPSAAGSRPGWRSWATWSSRSR